MPAAPCRSRAFLELAPEFRGEFDALPIAHCPLPIAYCPLPAGGHCPRRAPDAGLGRRGRAAALGREPGVPAIGLGPAGTGWAAGIPRAARYISKSGSSAADWTL